MTPKQIFISTFLRFPSRPDRIPAKDSPRFASGLIILSAVFSIMVVFRANAQISTPTNVLAVWYFNEKNNNAGQLSAVAAASITDPTRVTAANARAGSGLGYFGAGGLTANDHGYGTYSYVSAPSGLYVRCSATGSDELEASNANRYVSFILAPKSSYALSFSGLSAQVRLQADDSHTAEWFVRSSLDGFATNIAVMSVKGNSTIHMRINKKTLQS